MERVFRTANDEALVALVHAAQRRLVVIAPALTEAVASAVVARIPQHSKGLSLTIILDADPPVYRMGYGDLAALTILRDASVACEFNLRTQPEPDEPEPPAPKLGRLFQIIRRRTIVSCANQHP